MSTDNQDLLLRLKMQLAQQQNQGPSLFGLQAQQDPNQLAALVHNADNQAYVNGVGNDSGDWTSLFANAGKKELARAGQGIAGIFGIGTPAPIDNSASIAQQKAITQGKDDLSTQLQSGTDPIQAQLSVLSKLAQAGVPFAADALEKAQDRLTKQQTAQAEQFKNTAQGNASTDEIQNRAAQRTMDGKRFDQDTAKNTWTTIAQGGGYIVQKNGMGEIRTNKNQDAAAATAGSVDPGAIQALVDQKLTTGKDPAGLSKAGLMVPYLNALAARLDATGDTVGAANARASGYKAAGQTLDVTTKQLAQTQTSGAQIEKNIASLDAVSTKLGGVGSPVFQKALNQWNQGLVGDKDTAQAVFYINELQNEMARMSSGSFGNTPLSDSAKADAKELINKNMIGTGSMDGVKEASRASFANKLESIKGTRQGLIDTLSQNAKGSPFGKASQATAPAASPGSQPPQGVVTATAPNAAPSVPVNPLPSVNAQGWKLMRDAKGNQAYVGPNGQFSQVGK